uniref:Ig-like domain-containing protein n=1 Tax=Gadus morhua TaxID=8049 RepID=A0A8C5CGT2_GADMO
MTDAPKTPSVTVSPSGEIEEGSSVTLSCSSDANSAATYTWFKVTRAYPSREMKEGQQLVFNGKNIDDFVFMTDAPKTPSVTVRPSGEIEEGSSVTLSCSSDANPAAEYTWFKNNQPLPWEPSQPHTFPSLRPEDRGTYRCHAENKYGLLSSNSIFMDVQCELNICLIGKNLTLSCSSDANPAATYTWFRDTRAYPSREMKEGQLLFFSHILSSESGQYRCEATNKWGKDSVIYSINVNCE